MPARRDTMQEVCLEVDARCLGRSYRSQRVLDVCRLDGQPLGHYTLAPKVYLQDQIRRIRSTPQLSLAQRLERLKQGAQLFVGAELAGMSFDTYCTRVREVSGLPTEVVKGSAQRIVRGLERLEQALKAATPTGAVWSSEDPTAEQGCSLFSRKGEVLAVIAAGNGPGVHALWPQALAMGYRVLVRPSTREPLTAQRLVLALELAGLGNYAALLPTDHSGAETLIELCDLSIVYGGEELARRYSAHPRVLVQGPGRAKMLIGADADPAKAARLAAQSILDLGGAACVCTSAVLVEGDAKRFSQDLQRELDKLAPSTPRLLPTTMAEALQASLGADLTPGTLQTDRHGMRVHPLLTLVARADDPKVQRELPFACVTVAPFDPERDAGVLSHSLVLTVVSRQPHLIDLVLRDSSIANVYVGHIPSTWMDETVPHDGYLTDFLMCNRGYRVEAGWLDGS